VVLDQGRVGEGHAVVHAAAAAHRVLLQAAQSGGGLAGVADLGAGALEGVGPGTGGGGDTGEAAQDVEGAALGGEQVTGAGGDGQEHLAGFHAVAVLGVPLDLELLGADDGEDRLGDAQSRDHARLAGGEVGGGDGVLGDGGDGGDVLAVGQVLLDG